VQVLDLRRKTPNLKALEAGKLDELNWAMQDENLIDFKDLRRIEKEAAFRLKRAFERAPVRSTRSPAVTAARP